MSIFCLVTAFFYTKKVGMQNAWLIYVFAFISLGMFFVRRMQRKNQEKRNKKYGNN